MIEAMLFLHAANQTNALCKEREYNQKRLQDMHSNIRKKIDTYKTTKCYIYICCASKNIYKNILSQKEGGIKIIINAKEFSI